MRRFVLTIGPCWLAAIVLAAGSGSYAMGIDGVLPSVVASVQMGAVQAVPEEVDRGMMTDAFRWSHLRGPKTHSKTIVSGWSDLKVEAFSTDDELRKLIRDADRRGKIRRLRRLFPNDCFIERGVRARCHRCFCPIGWRTTRPNHQSGCLSPMN